MESERPCDGCAHRRSCSEVFERLGRQKGPSVAMVSVLAFVMPIVIFVAVLGGVEALLGRRFSPGQATATGVAAGFIVAGCSVAITAWWRKKKPPAADGDACHAADGRSQTMG